MTVNELCTLVDNLDEYIHVPGGIERLKKTVLHLAVSGQLVPQDPSEGTGADLYTQIQAEKQKLIREGKLKKQKPLPEITEDEIPFEIPKSWEWVRLGEIIELKSGADLTPHQYNADRDGIPYITGASNIENGKVIINRWTPDPKNIAKQGDLLLTCKGTVGLMAFLQEPQVHIARQLMAIQFTKLHNPDFIKSTIEAKIDNLQKAAQSIIPGIARNDVLSTTIALPSLAEQKRIVAKVDTIFKLIDELAEEYHAEQVERQKLVASSLAQLSRGQGSVAFQHLAEIIRTKSDATVLRTTILHLAVSGQLVPQDPGEGTGEELFAKIQAEKRKLAAKGKLKKQKSPPEITEDEIPFEIPKSWKWVRTVDAGYSLGQKKPDKDFYYIDVASIDNTHQKLKSPALTTAKDAPSRARKIVDAGSVIYSTVRPYLLNATVVKNQYAHELIASTAFAVLHPYSGVASNWVLMCLISQYFTDYTNEKSVGAAYPAINDAQFSRGLIPLPPLAEQTRIVQKTTQLLDLVTELEKYLEK